MNLTPRHPGRFRSQRLAIALVAASLLLGACGSSDDSEADAPSDDAAATTAAPSGDGDGSDDGDAAPQGDSGEGTATLTMADGTVYDLELTECVTSDMEQQGFAAGLGYDVHGKTADQEWDLQILRAMFSETEATQSGALESGFDENGQNATIIYQTSSESLSALTVDGTTLSGELEFSSIGPPGPHGAETTGTVEASC